MHIAVHEWHEVHEVEAADLKMRYSKRLEAQRVPGVCMASLPWRTPGRGGPEEAFTIHTSQKTGHCLLMSDGFCYEC